MALDPEFSCKLHLRLKHHPPLKLNYIFSTHISASLFSAGGVCFGVNNWTHRDRVCLGNQGMMLSIISNRTLSVSYLPTCTQDTLECY